MHADASDVKTTALTLILTIASWFTQIIPIETLVQGIVLAVVSTLIGFYGNKLLKQIDKYFQKKFNKEA